MPGHPPDPAAAQAAAPVARNGPGPARVTAVVVAHNGERWLPRVLAALAAQSRLPDAVVGVDTSSDDDSAAVLAAHVGHVVRAAPGAGFLDAARAGLAALDAAGLTPAADPHAAVAGEAGHQEWVWLLHDDSAPAPDALEHLLDAVELAPSVAVAGCKQRAWDAPDRLLQTGFTVSRLGRVLTGVEAGEVDQGQTDTREDVLAVGTAGMLVRRDVWERLAATDDLDLCLLVRSAGHRVVVVPAAVVAHADATRHGHRAGPAARRPLWWAARRRVAHRRLVDARALLLPLVVLAVLAGAAARVLARTAAKEPGRALGELTAVLAALGRPDLVWRARRRCARARRVPRRAVTALRASHGEVARWHRDRWHRWRARRRAALVPVEQQVPTAGGRRVPVVGALLLAAVSGLALHRLVGPGAVAGGALPPAPGELGDLWASARSSWVASGLGTVGPPDPFLTTLTAFAAPFGSPALAVTVLLLLAVPASGLSAWLAAGALTRSAWLRGWAALAWAAGPPLLAALDAGRLGPAVAHVALPWVALAVGRAVTAPTGRRAATVAAAGGLVLAVAATASPVLLPAGLLALLVVAVSGRLAGRRPLALVWTALPALALSGPWLVAAASEPRLLLADPGRVTSSPAPEEWRLLLAQPAEVAPWPLLPPEVAGTVAVAAGGVLVLVAVLALLRGGTRGAAVRAAWAVAVVGLLAALAATRVVVGAAPDGATVSGWAGGATSLVLVGLLVAVLAGTDGVRGRLGPRRGWRSAVAAVLAGAAVLAPVGGLAAWTGAELGGEGSLQRGEAPRLAAVAAEAAASPDRARTLVLRSTDDGTVSAAVARTAAEVLGATSTVDAARSVDGGLSDAMPSPPDAAQQALSASVAALVAGADDPRPLLADLGVGHVLLLDSAATTGPLTPEDLDGVQGLSRAGEVAAGVLWRVEPSGDAGPDSPRRAARARVLGPDGAPQAVLPASPVDVRAAVPAGEEGRLLVLAERAHPGWTAYLDHRRLEPAVHDGWAQAFVLGDEGGEVLVRHRLPGQGAWTALQVVVLTLTALLAVPVGGGTRTVRSR
ncbi:MAG: glycosyltransferase family 2 protein [Actinomycetes bacterium]